MDLVLPVRLTSDVNERSIRDAVRANITPGFRTVHLTGRALRVACDVKSRS